jgi:hypothetical protein
MSPVQAAGHATSTIVPVVFNYNGNDRIVRDLGREFEKQLRKLLRLAQLAGTFNITATMSVKGTTHSKGLIIGTPNGKHRSVEITWQEGSNDSRYSLFIATPHGMDPFAFHKKLKEAYEIFDPEEEDLPPQKPVGGGLRVTDHMGGKESVTSMDFAFPRLVHTQEQFDMLQDPVLVETFMREVYRWRTLRNNISCVSRDACLLILKQQCDIADPDKILARFVETKHFMEASADGFLAMSEDWLNRLRGLSGVEEMPTKPRLIAASEIPSQGGSFEDAAARAAAATQASTQASVPIEATIAAQPTPGKTISSASGNMKNAFATLEKQAGTAIELRRRLDEVDGEITNLKDLLSKAEERRVRITKSLERPDIKEAEERFKQVKTLLNIK